MTLSRFPGLIDPHVHLREPGATHKEDFATGTAAALAGGFTTVLGMPNTDPPLVDGESLSLAADLAAEKAYCDYGLYLGAAEDNASEASRLADRAAGLKLYLDATYGPLLLPNTQDWGEHFRRWPRGRPLVAHAEKRTLAAFLLFAVLHERPVHVCHVSRREEILLIKAAKEKGFPVTCEVTPHHLFLTRADIPALGEHRSRVMPPLGFPSDQEALWENLDVIDCLATDHAPHTVEEKTQSGAPPGFPGLETALPLMLTAVREGRLSQEKMLDMMVRQPRKIFSIPDQPDTWVEVDLKEQFLLRGSALKTKCAWTPFEGKRVQGRVIRVRLRGQDVYRDHQLLVEPGFGRDIRVTYRNG